MVLAVIRETIRDMDMVAIVRVVLTNREHIIALEPLGKGLVGTLLRYPYEVRMPMVIVVMTMVVVIGNRHGFLGGDAIGKTKDADAKGGAA